MRTAISLLLSLIFMFLGAHLSTAQHAVTKGLISYWPLDKDTIEGNKVKDVWGGQDALINGDPKVVEGKIGDALEFDGDDWLLITDDIKAAKLPVKEMTVEAWVYPEHFDDWGAFIGCAQDNGGFEKGWILGTVNNTEGAGPNEFSFAVSTVGADDGDGDLTYFHAGPYDTGQWYHVVGVYDGQVTRLYINGQLAVEGKNQTGEINYPDHAFFVIGVYKDDNEHFPFKGKLDEIRLYDRALTEEEVLQNFSAQGLPVEPAGRLAITWGEIKRNVR